MLVHQQAVLTQRLSSRGRSPHPEPQSSGRGDPPVSESYSRATPPKLQPCRLEDPPLPACREPCWPNAPQLQRSWSKPPSRDATAAL